MFRRGRMSMVGDWICGSCNHLNFYWRESCRRCKEPRSQDMNAAVSAGPRVFAFRPGDWFCDVGICQAHNFASRRFCFKCGVIKSIPSFGPTVGLGYYPTLPLPPPPPPFLSFSFMNPRISQRGWKPGDWFCGRYLFS